MKKKILTFIMALLLTITSVPFNVQAAGSTSGTTVAINATNFPDINFREYLQSHYGDVYGNINVDKITSLSPYNDEIKDLTGIELFPNLQSLYCYNNKLTSLDLSGNPKLAILECYKNQLTSINISNNPDLERLNCHDNFLTSLDASNCPELRRLLCYNNKLNSLNANNCSSLIDLTCNNCQLTSLSLLNCTKLLEIDCSAVTWY